MIISNSMNVSIDQYSVLPLLAVLFSVTFCSTADITDDINSYMHVCVS